MKKILIFAMASLIFIGCSSKPSTIKTKSPCACYDIVKVS